MNEIFDTKYLNCRLWALHKTSNKAWVTPTAERLIDAGARYVATLELISDQCEQTITKLSGHFDGTF